MKHLPYIICVAVLVLALVPALTLADSQSTLLPSSSSQAGTSSMASVAVSFVNQNPDPVPAGNVVELRFKLENFGSQDVHGLTFQLVPQYPFEPVSGENYTQTIPLLSAYQNGANALILSYKVMVSPQVQQTKPTIDLQESAAGGAGVVTQSFPVNVQGNQYAQIIYVNRATLEPGKQEPLSFTIHNIGITPLQNLVFSWAEPNNVVLPVYSDNTKYISSLAPGESAVLNYTAVADINAAPGLYQLDLSLKFDSANGTQTISSKAGVFIGGDTDFDVTYSTSSGGQTSFSIANIGDNPALSVTVRIPQQQGFATIGSNAAIVGNLDKGDYTIASFDIAARGAGGAGGAPSGSSAGQQPITRQRGTGSNGSFAASGPENLTVIVEYTDTTGTRHSVTKEVPLSASDISGSFAAAGGASSFASRRTRLSPLVIGGIVLLVVVIAGAVFIYFRRKRRAQQQAQQAAQARTQRGRQ